MFHHLKLLLHHVRIACGGGAIAYNNRGAMLLDRGRVDEAIVDLTRAIELDERLGKAYGNRAAARNIQQAWEQAVIDGNQAVQLDGSYFAHFHERGLALFQLGRFDVALADFDVALQLRPTNAPSLASRAATYQMLGRFDEAINDAQATLQLDASMVEPYAALAESLGNLRRFDEAVEAASEYITRRPAEWVGYHMRADIKSLAGNLEQASEDYDQALSLDSGLPRSTRGIGQHCTRSRRLYVGDRTRDTIIGDRTFAGRAFYTCD